MHIVANPTGLMQFWLSLRFAYARCNIRRYLYKALPLLQNRKCWTTLKYPQNVAEFKNVSLCMCIVQRSRLLDIWQGTGAYYISTKCRGKLFTTDSFGNINFIFSNAITIQVTRTREGYVRVQNSIMWINHPKQQHAYQQHVYQHHGPSHQMVEWPHIRLGNIEWLYK